MYKRLELHNHTTESDSSLTPLELIHFMLQDNVDAFAITDHNTISGHSKIRKILQEHTLPISCIYGMEFTTYYGHILCLNLKEYVSWENINVHKPELLFEAAKKKGALVGIAHPFSYGYPFARGCHFDMKITDFKKVDFIEIFNNPEPLHEVNKPGLLWWESLVLQGHHLSFTCGMDLHGKWDMSNQFATYIEGTPKGDIEQELSYAIENERTWITKGLILESKMNPSQNTITFTVININKPGFVPSNDHSYILMLRTKKRIFSKRIFENIPLTINLIELNNEKIILPRLYLQNLQIDHLITVAPTIYIS